MLCARLCACFPVKQRGVLSCRVTRARTSAGADRRSTRSGYVGWCGCVWAGGQATQRCTARATRRPPTWRATVLALSTWSASARGLSPLACSALCSVRSVSSRTFSLPPAPTHTCASMAEELPQLAPRLVLSARPLLALSLPPASCACLSSARVACGCECVGGEEGGAARVVCARAAEGARR